MIHRGGFILILLISFSVFGQTGSGEKLQKINNDAPTITAVGDQAYCPLSQQKIVADFNIVDPQNSDVDAFYIQISEGYIQSQERLILSGSHPTVTTSWNAQEGKLTLRGSGGNSVPYPEMIAAIKDVVFESSSPSFSGQRKFSFTLGDANYLPSTGHFYEYIQNTGITWTQAKAAAESRNYYGLQGYLATVTSAAEAQLTGEQASGAGWIGGSDVQQEGVWKWVTGPENGTIFWNGLANGSSPAGQYANWNFNEPNQAGDEDYCHITAPHIGKRGAWNDLSNTGAVSGDYQPKGYIVEYGGMPGDPVLNLSASSTLYLSKITTVTDNSRCGDGTVTLGAEANSGNVLWFSSPTNITPIAQGNNYTTPVLNSDTTYYVTTDECIDAERVEVKATILKIPDIKADISIKNCDEDGVPDGFTDFNLSEVLPFIYNGTSPNTDNHTYSYFADYNDAFTNTNAINPQPFNNSISSTAFLRVDDNNGCFTITAIHLDVTTTQIPATYEYELTGCDTDGTNDGFYTFNLDEATAEIVALFPQNQNLTVAYYRNLNDAQLEINKINAANSYVNETAFDQLVYVRVESLDNGDCFGLGPHMRLTVNSLPEFEVNPFEIYCTNLSPITLATFNPNDTYTYEWFDPQGFSLGTGDTITVAAAGIYTVIGTSTIGCNSLPREITVEASSVADLAISDIMVTDNSENNTISIIEANLGPGNYEYALNDPLGAFQDNPLFEQVLPGFHTVYVRDKNGCGTSSLEVAVFGFPKFFTPNNDGHNDTWQILGYSDKYIAQHPIYIFDRFGKLITALDPNGNGWNGQYNGDILPSSDYWYSFELTDTNGVTRVLRGHFSLVRQ